MQRVCWTKKLHFEGYHMMMLYPSEYDPSDFVITKTGKVNSLFKENNTMYLHIFGDDGNEYNIPARLCKLIF